MPRLSRHTQNDVALSQTRGVEPAHAFSQDNRPPLSDSAPGRRQTRRAAAQRPQPRVPQALHPPHPDPALYRAIVEQAFDGIIVAGADGRVIQANARACDMLGYAPGEIRGIDLCALLAPEDANRREGLLALLQPGDALRMECVMACKGGHAIAVDASIKMMDDFHTQVIMRDVTERKHAERALRESEANYRSLVDTSPDAVVVTDLEGRIVLTNRQATELFGYGTMEELVGLNVLDTVVPGDLQRARDNIGRVLETGSVRQAEYTLVRRDGTTLPAEVSSSLVLNEEEQPHGLMSVVRDITERKRAEQALSDLNHDLERRVAERTAQLEQAHKNMEGVYLEAQMAVREREELLSLVSHDLKNPLGAIKGFAQMLQRIVGRADMDEVTARKLVEGLAQIESASTRMNVLLNDQLDLARLQAGQPIELQRQPTDLAALARQVAAEYQRTTAHHRLWVVVPDEGVWGHWDAQRVERSLSNLVSNAVKYSPGGGDVEIVVEREEDEAGRYWARCRVSDHGLGIPEHDLPNIFEWYTRASNVVEAISGTGIGLASVRQVVEQHGGSVEVHSREGEGSTFIVRLPL
ncbi:MAG TPA: PAS domain S-box protein [Chloroflexia bacterium]|nr:PAS domain S-box protein [Chloroflexia bacterium]